MRNLAPVTAVLLALTLIPQPARAQAPLPPVRPPAVPLVAHDPYFSVWSFSDELNRDWPKHWTGSTHALVSMVRVDGKAYLLAGNPRMEGLDRMQQKSVEVLPTRTIYTFEGGGVGVTLTFLTPAPKSRPAQQPFPFELFGPSKNVARLPSNTLAMVSPALL